MFVYTYILYRRYHTLLSLPNLFLTLGSTMSLTIQQSFSTDCSNYSSNYNSNFNLQLQHLSPPPTESNHLFYSTTMPAYHSTFLGEESLDTRTVGNLSLLPIRTKYRGPAFEPDQDYDIVEETLDLFRANSFFKNFEIKGNADRVLIYGILFVSDCLSKLNKTMPHREATRVLNNLSLDNFALPGDINFPLNSLYLPPKTKADAELLRSYLTQFRQELAERLLARIYQDDENVPSKFWLSFTKRKFMNKSL